MKAPAFAYAKATSLAEAFELAARPGAKILAGGQSLIPALNMRLSSPELLVDITGLRELATITRTTGGLRIGALVTHAMLERSSEVAEQVPLLAQAVPHIAHPAIRNRGTLGGSLACGERRVKAGEFFRGLFDTDIRPGELLVGAEFPRAGRSVFLELARRHGDYAIIGLAGVANGAERRIAFCGAGGTPVLAERASRAPTLEAALAALRQDLNPPADLYNSSATKLHLAGVLLTRAWNSLAKPH
ncbi:MAG: FAD binding domain-containing protein [Betaproteobacteria bacterium]|nr:FAD binding domain-containing protein [Betaproteobacteria bacterium]